MGPPVLFGLVQVMNALREIVKSAIFGLGVLYIVGAILWPFMPEGVTMAPPALWFIAAWVGLTAVGWWVARGVAKWRAKWQARH